MADLNDVYAQITNKIITDLEKGELTWRKPWSSEHLAANVMRPLRHNDIPYTGINTIVLWASAAEQGFLSPYWMTYRQAAEMKSHVRKGEKATSIVYADKFVKKEINPEGKEVSVTIPFLKIYNVFNAQQIEGLPSAYYELPQPKIINPQERVESLEQFFAKTKARIVTGTEAAYFITADKIEMPPFESFIDAQHYYATLAHELTHWTRHPSRLNRDFGRKKHGDEGYAKEELVAELGACFLGADLGFAPKEYDSHASYIQSWLRVLKNDKRFLFTAAAFAQKAVEFMTGLQPPQSNNKPQQKFPLKGMQHV